MQTQTTGIAIATHITGTEHARHTTDMTTVTLERVY